MDFEKSLKNLINISKIKLSDNNSYDLIYELLEQTILPYNILTLSKGNYVYRARPTEIDEKFSSKSDLNYRTDIENISRFGRVNTPNQSMFYASQQTETSIFETSSLIRNNLIDIKSENLIMGRWFIKEDIQLLGIISNSIAIRNNKGLKELNKSIPPDQMGSNKHIQSIQKYFSDVFAKNAMGDSNNYKISAAYYNVMQKKLGNSIDGIMYPSVGYEYKDMNIAIIPKAADNSLILDMTAEYNINFNTNPRKITQVCLGEILQFDMKRISV